ncbi:MAG: hypothetical protein JWO31_3563, partial [Phycisphaerales bacterium]|nr:hypothetical protein [Phycisphaerales bacterium]
MTPRPIRTVLAAVACSLVVPALALVPCAAADDGPPTPQPPAATARAGVTTTAKVPAAAVGSWYYGSISPTT